MKKRLFTFIVIIYILFSLLYPSQIINAAKSGILIWFEQILPALLPFTILSAILINSNYLNSFSNSGNLLAVGITMISGFVFGFPIGAKLASDFYKTNLLSEKQAICLSITTNNFSPMYVCGFVLPTLFNNNVYLFSTYILIYILPLLIASFYLIITYKEENSYIRKRNPKSFQLYIYTIDCSIISGFQTLIKLCGYIVLFSIFTKILLLFLSNSSFFILFLIENLEITNGIQLLLESNLVSKNTYIIMIQLLSFGGISGLLQTYSLFSNSGLSIYKYIIGKVTLSLLLTLLSVIYVSYFIR